MCEVSSETRERVREQRPSSQDRSADERKIALRRKKLSTSPATENHHPFIKSFSAGPTVFFGVPVLSRRVPFCHYSRSRGPFIVFCFSYDRHADRHHTSWQAVLIREWHSACRTPLHRRLMVKNCWIFFCCREQLRRFWTVPAYNGPVFFSRREVFAKKTRRCTGHFIQAITLYGYIYVETTFTL